MSKIAEQKALEAYPVKELKDNFGTRDINRCMRDACIQGYDQAMQDFLEKTEKWFEDTQVENFICRDDGIYFENEKFVEQFKKYMQNG